MSGGLDGDDLEVDQEAEEAEQARANPLTDPLADEVSQLTAKYQRLAADFENYKRRKALETLEATQIGASTLLGALLPALDSLERAISHLPEDADDGLASGLRMTWRQLQEGLESQGVRRIPTLGERFDPRLHDAVVSLPAGDNEPNQVLAELLPGYTLRDRVIRPAQVGVAGAEPDTPAGQEPSSTVAEEPSSHAEGNPHHRRARGEGRSGELPN